MVAAISQFPPISGALADAVDAAFPERTPDPLVSERELWMQVGERRAARFIRSRYDYQQKHSNILKE